MEIKQPAYDFAPALHKASAAKGDSILLLGITGGGKSSIANGIVGSKTTYAEGHELASKTTACQTETVQWAGEEVTIIDTPGFLDSEGRDAAFLTAVKNFLSQFPKDKLRVVVVTLPLTEIRANSTYKDMIDVIELMLGEEVWQHAMFVTTCQNRVSASAVNIPERIDMWKQWLSEKCHLADAKHCNFDYNNALASLEPLRQLFIASKPFTPEPAAKLQAYIESNPGASVGEVIEKVDAMREMRERFMQQIEELKKAKEDAVRELEAQGKLSARLQASLEENKAHLADLQKKYTELQNMPRVTEIHHHHKSGGCIVS